MRSFYCLIFAGLLSFGSGYTDAHDCVVEIVTITQVVPSAPPSYFTQPSHDSEQTELLVSSYEFSRTLRNAVLEKTPKPRIALSIDPPRFIPHRGSTREAHSTL